MPMNEATTCGLCTPVTEALEEMPFLILSLSLPLFCICSIYIEPKAGEFLA